MFSLYQYCLVCADYTTTVLLIMTKMVAWSGIADSDNPKRMQFHATRVSGKSKRGARLEFFENLISQSILGLILGKLSSFLIQV